MTPAASGMGQETGSDRREEMTALQRRFLAAQLRDPTCGALNMGLLVRFPAADPDRLASAFDQVVMQSDVLRSVVSAVDNDPHMVVRSGLDLTSSLIEMPEGELATWAQLETSRPFDLRQGVYRSTIVVHPDTSVSWLTVAHHIATDATSSSLLVEQTVATYLGAQPPESAFYGWARAVSGSRAAALVDSTTLAGRNRVREADRPAGTGTRSAISPQLTARLVESAGGDYRLLTPNLSLTALLLTVSAALLARQGESTATFGIPIHHRNHATTEGLIGPTMNLHPVPIELDPATSCRELHRSVSRSLLATLRDANPAVEAPSDLVALVNVIPGAAIKPPATLPFTVEWVPTTIASDYRFEIQATNYAGATDTLELHVDAPTESDRDRWQRALEHVLAHPDRAVVDFDLHSSERLLEIAAHERAESTPPAELLGNALATRLRGNTSPVVYDEARSWTGDEIWIWVEAMARQLLDDTAPGDRIAIELDRCIEAVVMIFAAVLTGRSFVPINPQDPVQRRDVLCHRAGVVRRFNDPAGVRIAIDESPRLAPVNCSAKADDEAYLLYTSGSTGAPKGVPISQQGVADYIEFASAQYFGDVDPIKAPLFTSLTFDLTITTLFAPILCGGQLQIVAADGVPGLRAVAQAVDLTWLKATPSHLEALRPLLPSEHALSTIIVGGEAFTDRLANALLAWNPACRLFNEYGPTEAVVGCCVYEINSPLTRRRVPIGRPISNVALGVVDSNGARVDFEETGELLISHPGLTVGYLDGVEANRFVTIDGERWYRTGDLVFRQSDGVLIYVGRIDEELKIGGRRFDPSEIEHHLESHPSVERAAVRMHEHDGSSVLVAWVQPASDAKEPTRKTLVTHLRQHLPSWAIPEATVVVSRMPINSNGKLDVAALPAPTAASRSSAGATSGAKTPASTPLERVIETHWRSVLDVHDVGIDDDFFASGGDSLAAITMLLAIADETGVELRDEVFEHSTIRSLAAAIELADRGASEPRVRPPNPQPTNLVPPPLSSAELSLRYEAERHPDRLQLNLGRHYQISGPLDHERFGRATRQVAARHAALRWSHGEPRRPIEGPSAVEVTVRAGDRPSPTEAELQAFVRAPFDLQSGPLMRVLIAPRTMGTSVVIAIHHVCGDKRSLEILWSEIDACYHGRELPPLAIDTPDFREWQKLDAPRHLRWFEDTYRHPVSGPAPLRQLATGGDGLVERSTTISARTLENNSDGLPAATALAAAAIAIAPWYEGVVEFCLVASTRDHPVAQDLVGYLLNPVPVRVEVTGTESVLEIQRRAQNAVRDILAHRSVPYAEVTSHMGKAGLVAPSARVLVSLIDDAPAQFGAAPAPYSTIFTGDAVADLAFFVQRSGDHVSLLLEFNGTSVGPDSAEVVLRRFERAFHALHHEQALATAELTRPETMSFAHGGDGHDPQLLLDRAIEHTVSRGSDLAVECADRRLSWSQLGSRAAQVAEALVADGLQPGARVIAHVESSEFVPIVLLGVLAAGGVYVPIDPRHPVGRRRAIFEASDANIVVADDAIAFDVGRDPIGLSHSGIDDSPWRDDLELVRNATVSDDDIGYLIFTSGSTGTPNGVAIRHRQLTTSTRVRSLVYETEPDRFLLLSSPAFDSSLVGLLWTLDHGGTILVAPADAVADPDAIVSLIDSWEPSHLLCVPTMYRLLLERSASDASWVCHAIVAGEACHRELVQTHFDRFPDTLLTNEYGPTECAVWATAQHCQPGAIGPVPIGQPIPGTWIAVVDRDGRLCDNGVPGELIIGGASVADGYLDPSASDRFNGSFVGLPKVADGRIFQTGDRAVMYDGTTWFLGRLDEQLNIGGVRVDPGEVESVLERVDSVANVAVVTTDRRSLEELLEAAPIDSLAETMRRAALAQDPAAELRSELERYGTPRPTIVAHVEAERSLVHDLRSAATEHLPGSARPTDYVFHDRLPRGPTGKVDRGSLRVVVPTPVPDIVRAVPELTAGNHGPTPQRLCEIFGSVLNREDVIPEQSFFDLGGDSLAAFEVVRKLESELGRRISLRVVHTAPTAHELAVLLSASDPGAANGLVDDLVARRISGEQQTEQQAFFLHHVGPGAVLATTLASALGDDVSLTTLIDGRSVHMPYERPRPGTRFVSVVDLKDAYADEIERLQPTGPLVIIGFCQGGIYAHEVAAELDRRGRTVELLVCIRDWHAPDGGHVSIERRTGVFRLIARTFEQLLAGRQSLNAFAGAKARRLAAYASAALQRETRWSRTRRIGEQTFADHDAQTFSPHAVRTLVIRSSEDPYTPVELQQQGWKSVLADYTVEYVEGDPSLGAVVDDVARLIAQELST